MRIFNKIIKLTIEDVKDPKSKPEKVSTRDVKYCRDCKFFIPNNIGSSDISKCSNPVNYENDTLHLVRGPSDDEVLYSFCEIVREYRNKEGTCWVSKFEEDKPKDKLCV